MAASRSQEKGDRTLSFDQFCTALKTIADERYPRASTSHPAYPRGPKGFLMRGSSAVIYAIGGAPGLLLVLEAVFMTKTAERSRAALLGQVMASLHAAAGTQQRAWRCHRGRRVREALQLARTFRLQQEAQIKAANRLQAWGRAQVAKMRAMAIAKKQVCDTETGCRGWVASRLV